MSREKSIAYRRIPSSSDSSLETSNDCISKGTDSPFHDLSSEDMNESKYSKVIFNEISESYPTDADIECRFYIGDAVVPSDQDRIGLFRVGWHQTYDCLISKLVAECETDNEFGEKKVRFDASQLPKSTDEFFQFCYLSANDDICGASTPFRFIRLHVEDLIQLTDNKNSDEEDFVVVRSQQALIQERLQQLLNDNGVLEYSKRSLEQSLNSKNIEVLELRKELSELDDRYKTCQLESNRIMDKLKASEEQNSWKTERLDVLERELKETLRLNSDKDSHIESIQLELQKTMEALINNEMREKRTENMLKSRDQEVFDLIKKSSEQQVMIDELSSAKAMVEAKLELSSTSIAKVMSERRDLDLENKTLRSRLEDMKAKCDSLQSKTDIMMSEILDFDKIKLKSKVQSKTMSEEMDELRQKFAETESTKRSMSDEWKQKEDHFERQIAEMKLRLSNAAEEYQKVYKYNTKLETKIDKIKSKVKKYFDTKAQTKAAVDVSLTERQELMARAETEVKTVIENEASLDPTLLGATAMAPAVEERVDSIQLTQLPCIICNEEITCMSKDSKPMIQHLEEKHSQRLCPVCSTPFDATLPGHSKYFQMHVDNHFDTRQPPTAPTSPPSMYP